MKSLIITITTLLLLTGCTQVNQNELLQQTVENHSSQVNEEVGLQVGYVAPDFKYYNNTISELRGDKPVLMYFMATWCPYCRNDFNALKQVYKDYENDVQVIAQSLDLSETQTQLDEYKKQYEGLEDLLLLPGSEQALKDYNVRLTTTKYAIGRNGRILYAGSGEFTKEQWIILLNALKNSKA